MILQYLIMILIVVGMALSDIITGWIKACVVDRPRSKKMRIGGLNKLAEITIMLTACGCEIGIEKLGKYYDGPELAAIAGGITAISVFIYIVVMEIISILENYAEINPNAKWPKKFIEKFRAPEGKQEEKQNED